MEEVSSKSKNAKKIDFSVEIDASRDKKLHFLRKLDFLEQN